MRRSSLACTLAGVGSAYQFAAIAVELAPISVSHPGNSCDPSRGFWGRLQKTSCDPSRGFWGRLEPKMKKALKVGLLVIGALVVVPLLTLRVTGLEPRYVDPASEEFANSGRTAWPGLWLKGEVVHEPVTNWDWVREVNDPVRGNSIMLETRTWYGIPHSVTDRPYPARRQTLHPRNRTRIQTGQGVPLFQGVVDQCHTRSARAHEDRRKDL